jgi:transposase
MMTKNDENKRNLVQMVDIESQVPKDHLVRKIEAVIGFEFVRELVKDLYCENNGRPSIDPVVLVKIVFIQFLFGIRSMRQTIREIEVNNAYRWFLGLGFTDPVPHFSTFGKNYVRRFAENGLFEKIFKAILEQLIVQGFVKEETIFVDSTHIKAYANKRNVHNEYVQVDYNKYVNKLHVEINEEREKEGKKPIDFAETKKVAVSNADPDSGMFDKGEKEKQLAYSVQTAVDENGWVVGCETQAGSANDNNPGMGFLDKTKQEHPKVTAAVMDAGYTSPILLDLLLNSGVAPVVPTMKPKGKKLKDPETGESVERFAKAAFKFQEKDNCYICPWLKKLIYKGIDTKGYREYKTSKKDCRNCPFRHRCTNGDTKTVKRHLLEYAKEIAREIRLSDFGKELYPKRKFTVERTFAQAKMSHCLGFTLLRGLRKNQDRNLIVFAAANLKKLALFVAETNKGFVRITKPLFCFFHKVFFLFPKKQNPTFGIAS